MMNYLLLFSVAMFGGLIAFSRPKLDTGNYKLSLVFAGAYLFSITVIHILPELFHNSDDHGVLGILVLGGFFMQQVLEFVSKGVEHGHVHVHEKGHKHLESTAILALVALGFHAFLEGGMLANPSESHSANTLLLGVLIHKAPEAFALVSVLICEMSKTKSAIYLMVFALASPLGLFISQYLMADQIVSSIYFNYLFAIVCGNFLHISTTIVYESSSDHKFNSKKMIVALVAAGIAVAGEMMS
jgi:zinc and cadmium transporter